MVTRIPRRIPGARRCITLCTHCKRSRNKRQRFYGRISKSENNSELVAIFGNFINRAVVLTHKYYEGKFLTVERFLAQDKAVLNELQLFPNRVGGSIEKYRFREASQELLNLARLGNKYLADEEPWKRIKDAPERVPTIMHIALQIAAALSSICEPFLPHSAEKLRTILNINRPLSWQAIAEENSLLPCWTHHWKTTIAV